MESMSLKTNIAEIFKPENKHRLKEYMIIIKMLEIYTDNMNWYPEKTIKDFEAIDKKYVEKMTYDYHERANKQYESIAINQKYCSEIAKTYKPEEKYYKNADLEDIGNQAYNRQAEIEFEHFYYLI